MEYTKKHKNLNLGKSAYDVPIRKRSKLMLEMLEYKTRHKPDKSGD